MHSTARSVALALALCMPGLALSAEDVILRTGTLLECTLAEPNFWSKSAAVGDPLICYAGPYREFGRSVIPRGSYLVGRFTDYRNPGRLGGKGWIKLEFDRLILPQAEVPVLTKVVSARWLKVDVQGRILSRGHPKREVFGWRLPILWSAKVITLPIRGPYRLQVVRVQAADKRLPALRLEGDRFLLRADERERADQHFVNWYIGEGTPWGALHITSYTLTDENLNENIAHFFFGRKQSFIQPWKTKKFKLFNYHVLEELSWMAKLRFVKSIPKMPKAINADIERLNALRNGLARAFFPENLKKSKPEWKGKNIFTMEGLEAFLEDMAKINAYFLGVSPEDLEAL